MMTRYYTPDQCAGQIKSGKNGSAITRKTFLQNYATKAEFKAAVRRHQTSKKDIRFNADDFDKWLGIEAGSSNTMSESLTSMRRDSISLASQQRS